MKKGFMYLTAIIDVYSRKIVGWGLSNSLTAEWCKTVLQDAIANFGKPEIVNSDQGTQYTSALWTQYLEEQKIQISMDGKGRATDNIWIERFWKSVKYDYLYLNPAEDGFNSIKASRNTWPITTTRSIIPPCSHPTSYTKTLSKKQHKNPMKNDQILT